eukprot:scaffold4663_cov109-Cylindrotheca_fusiformis.AAC.7
MSPLSLSSRVVVDDDNSRADDSKDEDDDDRANNNDPSNSQGATNMTGTKIIVLVVANPEIEPKKMGK